MESSLIRSGVLGLAIFAIGTPVLADTSRGEAYFSDINGGGCNSCHYIDERKMVGPGLKGVSERHSEEWLRQFLTDPQATWKSDHAETLELKERMKKKRAPRSLCRKNEISEEQLTDLIDYLNSLQ